MIGAVVVTYNDDYKIQEWYEHYLEMKDAISEYIIVDNGSQKPYAEKVKSLFSEAHIIWLGENRGSTGAYNAGIRYLLNKTNVDTIALIGNDMKISSNALKNLEEKLLSDSKLGMIEPVILKKDCMVIDDRGNRIDRKNMLNIPLAHGETYDEIENPGFIYCDSVTGGMNISTREFYINVGLQDDLLFMYSDEVDMGIRAKKCGYKMGVLETEVAWHQHINPKGRVIRHPYSAYLMARNKIYLHYKHTNFWYAFRLFMKYFFVGIGGFALNVIRRNRETKRWYWWWLQGSLHGIFRDMKPNKYSSM